MILTLQPIAGLTISTVSDTVTYTGSIHQHRHGQQQRSGAVVLL